LFRQATYELAALRDEACYSLVNQPFVAEKRRVIIFEVPL